MAALQWLLPSCSTGGGGGGGGGGGRAPFLLPPCGRPKRISAISSSLHTRSTSTFSSPNLSSNAAFPNVVQRRKPVRLAVVCEAASDNKRYDSSEKRARQLLKRTRFNKAKKSEIRTRMKKVLIELAAIKKKKDAQAEEMPRIEKLIAKAYSVIDKAVSSGAIHKNAGANRKSRLARKKKDIEIHHGWYVPAATA